MFLEKTKLKDDSSNDADWVRDLRIILIVAQKNYVLDASLGERPATGATPDGYSFKSENNGCSIYMSNIFYASLLLSSFNLVFSRNISKT